ncbi:hypothetical protein BHM03_00043044 [Ensete ventricosum]|nr:hypothetical protein BHM03_00043044 [Ensete ventricosum]
MLLRDLTKQYYFLRLPVTYQVCHAEAVARVDAACPATWQRLRQYVGGTASCGPPASEAVAASGRRHCVALRRWAASMQPACQRRQSGRRGHSEADKKLFRNFCT